MVPFRLIDGPCVIENRDLVFQVADQVSNFFRQLLAIRAMVAGGAADSSL